MNAEVGSIEWTTDLETGISLLDEQHHRYIDLLNNYFKKVSEHSEADEKINQLTDSFDYLRQYAREHFATEESIMRELEYPDYLSHLKEHQHYVLHVGKLYMQMKTKGFSSQLSREVNFYTVEWFIEHILQADMKLVEFLNAKNQSTIDQMMPISTDYFEPQPVAL